MKKLAALILAVMMGATALACISGCSNNYGLNPAEPVTLTFWHCYTGLQRQEMEAAVLDFNETVGREKGIFVDPYSQGKIENITERVLAIANGEEDEEPLPDLFTVYADTSYRLDRLGKLADFSDYMSRRELSEYFESYLQESGDGYKLFPIAKTTEVLLLNYTDWKAFADATGASEESFKTWEGIAEMAEAYYLWSGGKAFFGRDNFANYMLVGSAQLGRPIIGLDDKDGYYLDQTVLRRLWDNYYVPYVKGHYLHEGQSRAEDVGNGSILAYVGSTSEATRFPNAVESDGSLREIKVRVYPIPNFAGTEPYAVQQGFGLAVAKSDATREYAATVFLKWLTEEERNLDFCAISGILPVKKSANSLTKLEDAFTRSESKGREVSSILKKTLRVGIQSVADSTLYPVNSYRVSSWRSVLENAMMDQAKSDASAVREGTVSLESCLTDEHFDDWFERFIDLF